MTAPSRLQELADRTEYLIALEEVQAIAEKRGVAFTLVMTDILKAWLKGKKRCGRPSQPSSVASLLASSPPSSQNGASQEK